MSGSAVVTYRGAWFLGKTLTEKLSALNATRRCAQLSTSSRSATVLHQREVRHIGLGGVPSALATLKIRLFVFQCAPPFVCSRSLFIQVCALQLPPPAIELQFHVSRQSAGRVTEALTRSPILGVVNGAHSRSW